MACRNDLEEEKVLIWYTRIPYEDEPRTSPAFTLMGSEWCLRFVYRDQAGDHHVITLHQMRDGKISEKSSIQNPFRVKCYMMHLTESDKIVTNVEDRSVVSTRHDLWWYRNDKKEIFSKLPWLYDRPEVKFACKFYGHPPSTLQLQIGTDDLSPVISKKLSVRTEDKNVQVSSEVPPDIESLSSDFSHLLEKEILPDVRLECGGRTFQAHRTVLVARSQVFRAMFQNGMLESETGAVKIQDMEVGVLQKLLKFLYSGKPDDLSEDCTADLYGAADKYDVPSMKQACAYWIVRNLSSENCVKYLKMADRHSDCDLKAELISFIIKNPDVFKRSEWLAISKELPVLAVEVLHAYIA